MMFVDIGCWGLIGVLMKLFKFYLTQDKQKTYTCIYDWFFRLKIVALHLDKCIFAGFIRISRVPMSFSQW